MENISLNVSWIFKLYESAKCKMRNIWISIKTFCWKWEGKTSPRQFFKWFALHNKYYLDNINLANKFLKTYLLARSNVPHFFTKKASVIILTFCPSRRSFNFAPRIKTKFKDFSGKIKKKYIYRDQLIFYRGANQKLC